MNFVCVNIMIPTNRSDRKPRHDIYTLQSYLQIAMFTNFHFLSNCFCVKSHNEIKQMSRLAKPTNAAIPNEIVKNFDLPTTTKTDDERQTFVSSQNGPTKSE